mgnify:FL=1
MITIEKNTDIKIKCYKCGNEYLMSMMRMDPNGKNLACRNCLERKPVHKQEMKKAEDAKIQKSQKEESPMKEYFCKECKFNFKRAKHITVSICPYCGSGNINVKGSTARIMADAFRMKGD